MKKVLLIGGAIVVALIVINMVRDIDPTKEAGVKEATNDPDPSAIAYDCGGEQIHVDFNNDVEPQTADIYFDDKSQVLTLPAMEAGSGAKYGNDTVTFWTHQGEATFEYDGKSLSCTEEVATPGIDGGVAVGDIPEGCVSWFDGCNNCSVGEDGVQMACTMMYCETPVEPYCLKYEDGSSDAPVETTVSAEIVDGISNATYRIEGEEVTLVAGSSSVEAAPGSATKVETQITEFMAEGDLQQGSGATLDGGVVLTQDPGGSGTFYYVGATIQQPDDTYLAALDTHFLGDRITIKEIAIDGRMVIVTYLDRSDDQAMSDAPTVEVTKKFATKGVGTTDLVLMDVTPN